jgi:hypothetical protein
VRQLAAAAAKWAKLQETNMMRERKRQMRKLPAVAVACVLCAAMRGESISALAPSKTVDEESVIVAMVERSRAAARDFHEYKVTRIFQAENRRFSKKASMMVETMVDSNRHAESRLISFEGSDLIRKRVFEKILEAEAEAENQREDVDVTPANYKFCFLRIEHWNGRPSYVFAIAPLKKNKYAVQGSIWLDCQDLHIARLVGSPLIRPSFWTTSSKIEKDYQKLGNRWLPARVFSESSIFLAGRSTLEIEYQYPLGQ